MFLPISWAGTSFVFMILILSISADTTTDKIIDWLIHFNISYFRLNDDDFLKYEFSYDFQKQDCNLKIDGADLSLKDVKVVWFRKFGFFTSSDVHNYFNKKIDKLNSEKLTHLSSEYNVIRQFILLQLKEKKWLADFNAVLLNKPNVLQIAQTCGLKIPNTYIINQSDALSKASQSKKLITKPLSNTKFFNSDNGGFYGTYTTRIPTTLYSFTDSFFPSLVQEEIPKDYEIRIFFLTGNFYSMAIFSQGNEKTSVDFRKYDNERPNRWVPYNLPTGIKLKLTALMNSLNLNVGSIDLIKSLDGDYYFLEINPGGQFGMVEEPCNYPLHKQVAVCLKNMLYE